MSFDHTSQKEKLNIAFLRAQSRILGLVEEMEKEMQYMKEKKLSDSLIDKKDWQIEQIAEFYNEADELITYYKLALANARIENHFLTEMLCKKICIEELVQYKPSLKIIIQKADQEDLPQTLSELNG